MNRCKLSIIVLLLAGVACSLPGSTPTVSFETPTPDLTLTAIFAVLYITPATATPSETPVFVPPTATETPLFSSTPDPATLAAALTAAAQTSIAATALAPTFTHTPLPLPTFTSTPAYRGGASMTATYLPVSPEIDGSLGEWRISSYTVNHVVFGRDRWDNAADLSGSVMVGWDNQNLYLGARVVDEDYEQNTNGSDLWRGDSLEVLLDTNLAGDFYVNSLSPDDFQLGVSPGETEPDNDPEAYLWFPSNIQGSRDQVEIAAQRTDDGYTVEVAIPWSVFEMTPQAGRHYGFCFSVSDNDIDGGIAQQSMVSNVSTRSLTNPTTWGDLVLAHP